MRTIHPFTRIQSIQIAGSQDLLQPHYSTTVCGNIAPYGLICPKPALPPLTTLRPAGHVTSQRAAGDTASDILTALRTANTITTDVSGALSPQVSNVDTTTPKPGTDLSSPQSNPIIKDISTPTTPAPAATGWAGLSAAEKAGIIGGGALLLGGLGYGIYRASKPKRGRPRGT